MAVAWIAYLAFDAVREGSATYQRMLALALATLADRPRWCDSRRLAPGAMVAIDARHAGSRRGGRTADDQGKPLVMTVRESTRGALDRPP